MKAKPILFSTDMVQAILENRKSMTRRIIKPQPADDISIDKSFKNHTMFRSSLKHDYGSSTVHPPKYQVGDILYVRETWNTTDDCGLFPPWKSTGTHYMYKADAPDSEAAKTAKWRPSIFMPKEAARIFLRVTDVRVERVNNITVPDCEAEGVTVPFCTRENFVKLWNSINEKRGYGWDVNPWVWIYEFEVIDPTLKAAADRADAPLLQSAT